MCMGGGQAATIYAPKTEAYDRLAERQFEAMQAIQEGKTQRKQQKLNQAIRGEQDLLARLKEVQIQQANNVSAQAGRLAALAGPPPPDKTAQVPTVGRAREKTGTTKSKSALRIERQLAATSSQGTGLNIT